MESSETQETSPQDDASGLANRFMASMKNTAVQAAKYAQLRSLMWELSRADEATGVKAFAGRIGQRELSTIYARISQIDDEVAQRRRAEPAPKTEAMTDKAARLAFEAKKRLEIEALLSERNKRLRELGEALRANTDLSANPSLDDELKRSRSVNLKVETLNAEIGSLSRQSSGVLKMAVVCAAAVCILFFGYWLFGFLRSKPSYRVTTASSGAAKTNAASESIKKQVAEVTHRIENERAEREATRKLNAEKAALELEHRKLDSARKAREQETARFQEQQKSRMEESNRAAKAQEDRQQLADALFGRVVLDPSKNVTLSRTLRDAHKATVELRGPQYAEIAKLHANHKWVELINLVTKNSYTELPNAYEIESGARNLLSFDLTMLVTTTSTFDRHGDNAPLLHLVTFPVEIVRGLSNGSGRAIYPAPVQVDSAYWQRHPDGIGYLHKWHPRDRMSVVVLAPWGKVNSKVEQLNRQLDQKRSELKAKADLGEISEASVETEMAATADRVYNDALSWATGL